MRCSAWNFSQLSVVPGEPGAKGQKGEVGLGTMGDSGLPGPPGKHFLLAFGMERAGELLPLQGQGAA